MKIRLIAIIVVIFLGIASLIAVISSGVSTNKTYQEYITKAESYAERDVPYLSVTNYLKAFEIKNQDEKIYQDYLAQTALLDDSYHTESDTFYSAAVKAYIEHFPKSTIAYETLCKYYSEVMGSHKYVIETALAALDAGVANENIKNYYMKSFYTVIPRRGGFQTATSLLGGVALVSKEGKYGYFNGEDYVIGTVYDNASILINGYMSVQFEGKWQMVNSNGYKVENVTGDVDYVSSLNNGLVLMKKGKKFAYSDASLVAPEEFKYDNATIFKNSVAAVCVDKKWALISSDGNMITDYIFDDIIIDEYNTCINNGIIFAKTDSKYCMYNAKGEKIGDLSFDDAFGFFDSGYAAVCVDEKWGFVNSEGEMVIEPQYDEAKSFGLSIAPVLIDGAWGYINTSNEIVIEPIYADAYPFTANGYARVSDGELWQFVRLAGYSVND